MAVSSSSAEDRAARFGALDVLRGIAVLAMIVYHGSWDLRAFGLISVDVVNQPGWHIFARLIAGTFVALVGVNLVLATRRGFRTAAFLRRLAVLVGAAGLVSLGTYLMDPGTFVFFGILHAIAVASVLAVPFLGAPLSVVVVVAVVSLLAPYYLSYPVFDAPWWWWLGLTPDPPSTVDYVPLLPWFGVVLAGIFLGRLFLASGADGALARWRPSNAAERLVALVGRWSLAVYLVHQPILIGVLFLVVPLLAPSRHAVADQFMSDCAATCRANGHDTPTCELFCGCVLTGLKGANLPIDGAGDSLSAANRERTLAIVGQCRPKPEPAASPAAND